MDVNIEEKIENYKELKQIIKNGGNVELVKNFIKETNLSAYDFNDFGELLGFTIRHNANLKLIEYIIHERHGVTLNYQIKHGNIITTPLMLAVANNNFRVANLLIKNKANINYGTIKNVKYYSMMESLLEQQQLNDENLKYILLQGFNLKRITDDIIYQLIKEHKSSLLEIIFRHWKFNSSFVLRLLHLYKNNKRVSQEQFQSLIEEEENKIPINEKMYQIAIDNSNFTALEILFNYDCYNRNRILKRIIKFDLLEMSVKMDSFSFIKKLLLYKPLNYKCINYLQIIVDAINLSIDSNLSEEDQLFIPYLIQNFIYKSSNTLEKTFWIRTSLKKKKYDIRYLNLVLNIVIKMEYLPLVKYLVDGSDFKSSNGDIDAKDINGEIPIITALCVDNLEIFNYLLEHGADPNTTNVNGVSLLSMAIHEENIEIIKILLNYNVKLNMVDPNEILPFTKAINKDSSDIVDLFINYSNKHNINIYMNNEENEEEEEDDEDNESCIDSEASVVFGGSSTTEVNDTLDSRDLMQHSNMNSSGNNFTGNSPLIKAINHNNFDMVYSLVNYGKNRDIDMNAKDIYGNTPLILSYNKEYISIFKFLVEYLDINQKDNGGNTILHYAVDRGDSEMVKSLISIGADINSFNYAGNTVLDRAISKGNFIILKLLLHSNHIIVNRKNSQGKTPLISIIEDYQYSLDEKVKVVNSLIEKGSNVNLSDNLGQTALIYAVEYDYFPIVKLLLENGADLNLKRNNTLIDYTSQIQDYNIVKILFDYGLEIYNINNVKYDTLKPLIHSNNLNLLKLILDNNITIDINMKGDNGNTLLHEAVKKHKTDIVKYLVQRGADVSLINNHMQDAHDINYKSNYKSYPIAYEEIENILFF